jgi:hypothetical protein
MLTLQAGTAVTALLAATTAIKWGLEKLASTVSVFAGGLEIPKRVIGTCTP